MVAEIVLSAADGNRDGSSPDPPNTMNSGAADGNRDGSSPDPPNTMNSECVWQFDQGDRHERRAARPAINVNECLKPDPESTVLEIGRRP